MPLLTTRAALSSSGFKASGNRLAVNILAVGGGGGGWAPGVNDSPGGGGGGGQATNLVYSLTRGNYNVAVGNGGSGGGIPSQGNLSSFASFVTAFGGGYAPASYEGGSGGNGSLGGPLRIQSGSYAGGGGGGVTNGFGGAFFDGSFGFGWYGGTPGPGYVWIDGNTYGQGGGGAAISNGDLVYGGGIGGAGNPRGAAIDRIGGLVRPAVAPIDGTGFGGTGGATFSPYFADATDGADGCVIVSYEGGAAVASGGTIVISGGRVYHKFTTPGGFVFSY